MRIYHIASALITDQDWVLMVKQKRPDRVREHRFTGVDADYFWGFAGGKIETGETEQDALRREIREETGLLVDHVADPILTCVYGDRYLNWKCLVTAFHVEHARTAPLTHNDPDGEILLPQWFKRDEAIALIKKIPWQSMREPMLHYLQNGKTRQGWYYLQLNDGSYLRV